MIVIATEKKPENRISVGKLFCQMIKEKVLKHSEFEQGYVVVCRNFYVTDGFVVNRNSFCITILSKSDESFFDMT